MKKSVAMNVYKNVCILCGVRLDKQALLVSLKRNTDILPCLLCGSVVNCANTIFFHQVFLFAFLFRVQL